LGPWLGGPRAGHDRQVVYRGCHVRFRSVPGRAARVCRRCRVRRIGIRGRGCRRVLVRRAGGGGAIEPPSSIGLTSRSATRTTRSPESQRSHSPRTEGAASIGTLGPCTRAGSSAPGAGRCPSPPMPDTMLRATRARAGDPPDADWPIPSWQLPLGTPSCMPPKLIHPTSVRRQIPFMSLRLFDKKLICEPVRRSAHARPRTG
jgi:hypothetical protein